MLECVVASSIIRLMVVPSAKALLRQAAEASVDDMQSNRKILQDGKHYDEERDGAQ